MKRNARGFTLMELMVVIVIVAILAAVAVPLYLNYVKDAQRTEAKGAMGAIITAEQASFQKDGAYKAGGDSKAVEDALGIDLGDAKVNWVFSVVVNNEDTPATTGFVITAATNSNATKDIPDVTYTYTRDAASQPTNPWNS